MRSTTRYWSNFRRALILGLLASIAVTPSLVAQGKATAGKTVQAEVNPHGYTSSHTCGQCHTDIYESWRTSLHAFALTDPIFDAAYMQAVKTGGEEARRLCLRCHAPMTAVNGDFLLEEGVTREGVSCDFCHTVTAVHLDGREKPYSVDLSLVKRSVVKDADSPAHEVAYSELHTTSAFCGGCHNLVTPAGVAIMGTYDEWSKGPYPAEGKQCQDCHMSVTRGQIVSPEILTAGVKVHRHDLIHDREQLRSAVTMSIRDARIVGSGLRVEIELENTGSGHMVPTGIPTREVVLSVTVEGGERVLTQEKRYRKVVADAQGHTLEGDYLVLLKGARVLNDNRLAPREKRVESFVFPVPRSRTRKVTATLRYLYSPVIVRQQPVEVELGSSERYVEE